MYHKTFLIHLQYNFDYLWIFTSQNSHIVPFVYLRSLLVWLFYPTLFGEQIVCLLDGVPLFIGKLTMKLTMYQMHKLIKNNYIPDLQIEPIHFQ